MSAASHASELVAGRYAIEDMIAQGGMGAVYRAYDRAQSRSVALKRLLSGSDMRRRTRMFEREFYTLAGLKHPRIIEVYEYGIDQKSAYYTMELLGGRDLRELAPLPYRTACRYLRDIANCLALLHARGLLHRDISPRNVRITDDGRAKLFDFGTLCSFGRSTKAMGTPPLMPPEALRSGALDQRADLYSLGALAYWMVTSRHAYHARSVEQLPEMWSRAPLPPSLLVPKDAPFEPLPPELDALILTLLDHNPLARPVNAAEVVARLSAIAQLTSNDEPLSALSYLHGGKPVGRARQRAKLRHCVKAAIKGEGSLTTIEAEAGMGSGRMLADLAIEAQLLGAVAIVADARAQAGAFGVIDQLAHALFAIDKDHALAAMGENVALLSRFVPESLKPTGRQSTPAAHENIGDPREARLRTQSALLAWLERFAERVPLTLGVRALHRADDASMALLSALAHGIEPHRIALVLAFDPDEAGSATAAFANLVKCASVALRLPGFNHEETHTLVRATFGAVQGTERLAEWLHELTSGNPQHSIDLLQHLIEQQVVRFIDGMWVLPTELSAGVLPRDLSQALDARIARLPAAAEKLALALSVHRAAIPLERCLAIAALEQIEEPQRALAELAQRGVIAVGEDDVRFGHRAIHDAVSRRLSDAESKRLHGQFGRLLVAEARDDADAMLDAGWHLLHSGDERRGAELLADLGAVRSADDTRSDLIPALEAALEVYRRLGYPKHDVARVVTSIAAAGFFYDRRFVERYSDEGLALMQDVLGLPIARKWQPRIGARLALGLGFGVALTRLALAMGPLKALRRFSEAITLFCTTVVSAAAAAALTMDAPRARRVAAAIDPLRALGPDSAPYVLSEYSRSLTMVPEDRLLPAIAGSRAVVERLDQPRPIIGLTPGVRQMTKMNALYAWGSLEALREEPQALRIAATLDGFGMKIGNLYADQIRACYHGIRGEVASAEEHKKRVELYSLQAGSAWLAEIWAPTSAILFYLISRDGVGIRRVMGELERLSAEIPSLERYARLARAAYYVLHGDDFAALDAIRELMEAEPRSFIGWTAMTGTAVRALYRTGDREKARAIGENLIAQLDEGELSVTSMVVPLITELALLEAERNGPEAARRIDDYLKAIGTRGGPMTLGTLHEARAQIALLTGDEQGAREHLAHVKRCFISTENPVLIARCERLQREVESGHLELTPRGGDEAIHAGVEAVRTALGHCITAKERAAAALDLVLKEAGAQAGYLFARDEEELLLLCQRAGEAPTRELCERVLGELDGESTRSSIATRMQTQRKPRPTEYRVLLLTRAKTAGRRAVAAVALVDDGSLRALPPAFLSAIASALGEMTTTPSS